MITDRVAQPEDRTQNWTHMAPPMFTRGIRCQICWQERRSGFTRGLCIQWDPFYGPFYLADSAGEPGWQVHNFFTLSSYLGLGLRVIGGRDEQIKSFKYQRDVPRSATLWNNSFFFCNAKITIAFAVNVIRHAIYVIRAYTCLYTSIKSHLVLGRQ